MEAVARFDASWGSSVDGMKSAIVVLRNATNKERVRKRGKKARRRAKYAREEIGYLGLLKAGASR
jgi:hypothetical protein